MNLTEEQLSEIREMAGLFFPIEDIAENIEENIEEIETEMTLKAGDFYTAYRAGWLEAEIKLRKSIQQAAENGSNPAQQMLLNFQKNAK
jgi:hypothetical protein